MIEFFLQTIDAWLWDLRLTNFMYIDAQKGGKSVAKNIAKESPSVKITSPSKSNLVKNEFQKHKYFWQRICIKRLARLQWPPWYKVVGLEL